MPPLEADVLHASSCQPTCKKILHTTPYLSMIRGLGNNCIAACKTGNPAPDALRLAMRREEKKATAELRLHSGPGVPYASQACFEPAQTYGIAPPMSRRRTPL